MAVSIDIGTRAIHIIAGQARKSGSITISGSKLIMIPSAILSEGQSQRQSSIFLLIKPALDAMKIRHTDCSFTLSDDRFLIRELKLPKVTDKELHNIARQEMIDLYNASEDDLVEIDSITRLPDGTVNVRAAAFSKALVDGYRDFAINSSLTPHSLSFHSSSIGKLITTNPEINGYPIGNANVILVDMGMFACIVHMISSGKSVFSRSLPIGFTEMYQSLTSIAHHDDRDSSKILRSASFNPESDVYKSYPPHIAQYIGIFSIKLIDELSKTLRFLSSSKIAGHIDAVFLFGGGAQIPEIAPMLGKAVGIRTEEVHTVSTISIPAGIVDELPFLLNCAGSLLV